MPSPLTQLADGTIDQVLHLQARLDALTAMVKMLALQEGVESAAFDKELEAVTGIALQKRLEALEDLAPGVAARIDRRPDMPALDPDLLDGLKWKDEE